MNVTQKSTPFALALLAYIPYLFYIVLFPFHDWHVPTESIVSTILFGWLEHVFLFDIVHNLILFLPYGFLAGCTLATQNKPKLWSLFIVTLSAMLTSTLIEVLQTFNPARIPALLDISLNTISGFLGALLVPTLLPVIPKLIQEMRACVHQHFISNHWAWLGAAVWLVFGLYHLKPFIPTLHPQQLLISIDPMLQFFRGEIEFSKSLFVLWILQGMLLYFSGKLFLNATRLPVVLFGFVMMLFLGKLAIITVSLEPEYVFGSILSLGFLVLGQKAIHLRFDPKRANETKDEVLS